MPIHAELGVELKGADGGECPPRDRVLSLIPCSQEVVGSSPMTGIPSHCQPCGGPVIGPKITNAQGASGLRSLI